MPIKRDQNIILLSREHHHGLLFCWKIRQGEKLLIAVERAVSYIKYFWKNQLERHFDKEERILFPLLDDPLTEEGLLQHKNIRQQVERCTKEMAGWSDCIKLSEMINHHIRYEERVLFPHFEKNLCEADLISVGLKLSEESSEAEDGYEDEFWSKST